MIDIADRVADCQRLINEDGNFNAGYNIINIENKDLKDLANGAYYVIIILNNNKGDEYRSKSTPLIILK
ncbi:MAG: hypothetical protein N3E50_05190 [Candidatus Goldbacteria bacterium]|nr:hypothetical protein [Candidatus Goldiibacteriota bacterium]